MRNKFFEYLDTLESDSNESLIEAIKEGYNAMYEEIIMTPLPRARITGWGDSPENTEPITSDWNIKPNANKEYFNQTLPDSVLNITNKSYIGNRVGTFPNPPRTHTRADGDKNLNGTWGDSNGEYVGDSYGYNLGGPSEVG